MTNCLIFAWRNWRYGQSDGLVIRKSHWGWFPHFSVTYELADGTLVKKEFVPDSPVKRRFPPIFFKGHVKETRYQPEYQP